MNKTLEKRASGVRNMQASAEKIWGSAQEQLRSMLSADTYNLWFAPLRAVEFDGDCVVLEVANDLWEAAQKIVKLTGKAA